MRKPIRVAICGQSIAWAVVEAAQHRLPHLNIIRCTVPELRANLSKSPVDVILFGSKTTSFKKGLLPGDPAASPVLLKLDFDNINLVEPLFNQGRHPVFADLILAIQDELQVDQQ